MNQFVPGDVPAAGPATRDETSSAALTVVGKLLANSCTSSSKLEDWLGEIARAFGARVARLVALLDNEPVAQHVFAFESDGMVTVPWPWEREPQLLQALRKTPLALATRSADGRRSFLTASGQYEGIQWLLGLEDVSARNWSEHERAALTLTLLALTRFTATQENIDSWTNWAGRAQTQQRLDDAALVVGRLVHDFNNVLTSILGFTELSLGQLPADSLQHEFMTEVYTAAQQGNKLLNQLSRFSMRKAVPQGRGTSLRLLAEEEVTRLRKTWGSAVSLEMLVPADLPALSMDADSLRVVLEKLLENAREAIGSTGTVMLSVRKVELTKFDCLGLLGKVSPGAYVEVTVADSGRGFSPEARRRVFVDPFFSTKPRHRGLGLASVYGILNTCGGAIRLEHGQESGTAVRIYLRAETSDTVPNRTSPSVNGERLLVVDDDPLTLQFMCHTLQQAGYRVQPAVDGVQALDSFAASVEPFHLVLSDVAMPRMTGFDLAQRLFDRDPRTNVLFTSGNLPAGFLPAGLVGRNIDVLPKPFRPESLLRAVRAALERDTHAAMS